MENNVSGLIPKITFKNWVQKPLTVTLIIAWAMAFYFMYAYYKTSEENKSENRLDKKQIMDVNQALVKHNQELSIENKVNERIIESQSAEINSYKKTLDSFLRSRTEKQVERLLKHQR